MTYNETVRAAEKNKKGIDFKFSEDRILADLQQYVEATYDSHYAQTKSYQATEIIIDPVSYTHLTLPTNREV